MSEKTLRASDLDQFTGTTKWVRHWLNPAITYTDGVEYVAETGGAFWLLDAIVSHQCTHAVRVLEFQIWKLKVAENKTARLTCEDDDGFIVAVQEISFTDFPLPEITIWLVNAVMLLPSEY